MPEIQPTLQAGICLCLVENINMETYQLKYRRVTHKTDYKALFYYLMLVKGRTNIYFVKYLWLLEDGAHLPGVCKVYKSRLVFF